MVCKEDVVLWFQTLKSYNRIDIIHTLLNMCLPFELRFLGTCLEEFVRLEGSELRGIDLRVNNAAELTSELTACQLTEPTNRYVRRKMALYLALLRENHCIQEMFNLLTAWGNHEFLKTAEGDPLEELLLVYMMAALHPKFESYQRDICGIIFNKIQLAAGEENDGIGQQQTMQDVAEMFVPHNKAPGTNTSSNPLIAGGNYAATGVTNVTTAVGVTAISAKPLPQSNLPYSIAPTLAEQTPSVNVMSQLGSFEPSTGSQVINYS